jgi:hypothetical protein
MADVPSGVQFCSNADDLNLQCFNAICDTGGYTASFKNPTMRSPRALAAMEFGHHDQSIY